MMRDLKAWIHFGGNQKLAMNVAGYKRHGLLSQMDLHSLSNCLILGVLAKSLEPQCINL